MIRACPLSAPVRTHQVHVQDDTVFVTVSEAEPNRLPGLSVGGES